MSLELRDLEIESKHTYLVFDKETGEIVHIHRIVTHRGAESLADERAQARALDLAKSFGHGPEKTAVIRADDFDSSIHHKVDVKTRQVLADAVATKKSG